MNKKEFFRALVILGVGFLLLGAYQFNQFWATQAVIGPQLAQLNEIDPAIAELAGVDLETMKENVSITTNVMLQIALADFVIGALLLFVGVTQNKK